MPSFGEKLFNAILGIAYSLKFANTSIFLRSIPPTVKFHFRTN